MCVKERSVCVFVRETAREKEREREGACAREPDRQTRLSAPPSGG